MFVSHYFEFVVYYLNVYVLKGVFVFQFYERSLNKTHKIQIIEEYHIKKIFKN